MRTPNLPEVTTSHLTPAGQREALAALCHDQWASYMLYFLDYLAKLNPPKRDKSLVVPGGYVAALRVLIETNYEDLSPEQQDNDRREADKFLALFYEWIEPAFQPAQLNYPSRVPLPTPTE